MVKKIVSDLVKTLARFCAIAVSLARSRIAVIALQEFRHACWRRKLQSLGPDPAIYPSVVMHCPERISIGRLVSIAEFCHIWGGGYVEIGDEVMIASHVSITSQSHFTAPHLRRQANNKPVKIGNRVWIGTHAVILPGVTIGDDAIIAAGAVVTRDVPPLTVASGIPARHQKIADRTNAS